MHPIRRSKASTDTGVNWAVDNDEGLWQYFGVASNVSFNRIAGTGQMQTGILRLIYFPPHVSHVALSVVNNYSSSPFNWALSNTTGTHLQFNIGQAMFLRAPGGLAFTLTDTSVSAVPVPASVWLHATGLVCLLSISRKPDLA